ncbi:DUF2336 domain-containing protein [Allorhizobium taibaishanense]|nr:hypothetical protein BJF91_04925 [Allorhizobium taibaishanense]
MATVSSFESLDHPRKSDLTQFAILFQPLFHSSSPEARREAVAALSQSANVPQAVAFFIASQPVAICAPFLIASPCLADDQLITIARTQGKAHADAIMRRDNLSPAVIDALAGLRFVDPKPTRAGPQQADAVPTKAPEIAPDMAPELMEAPPRIIRMRPDHTTSDADMQATSAAELAPTQAEMPASAEAAATEAPSTEIDAGEAEPILLTPVEAGRAEREEALRQTLKALDRHLHRQDQDRLGLISLTPVQAALLVRFAREGETSAFASALADALSSSRWLAERILLDTSGQQLATTLAGLAVDIPDMVFVLTRLYPHLSQLQHGEPRVARLIAGLDARNCERRIDTWLRADRYTYQTDGMAQSKDGKQSKAG